MKCKTDNIFTYQKLSPCVYSLTLLITRLFKFTFRRDDNKRRPSSTSSPSFKLRCCCYTSSSMSNRESLLGNAHLQILSAPTFDPHTLTPFFLVLPSPSHLLTKFPRGIISILPLPFFFLFRPPFNFHLDVGSFIQLKIPNMSRSSGRNFTPIILDHQR